MKMSREFQLEYVSRLSRSRSSTVSQAAQKVFNSIHRLSGARPSLLMAKSLTNDFSSKDINTIVIATTFCYKIRICLEQIGRFLSAKVTKPSVSRSRTVKRKQHGAIDVDVDYMDVA